MPTWVADSVRSRELLDVPEGDEPERVGRAVAGGDAEATEASVGNALEVRPHVGAGRSGKAVGEEVVERHLGLDTVFDHGGDLGVQLVVEQVAPLAAHGVDDGEGEGEVHVAALVAEHPVRARGQTAEETCGAQEVHVAEGPEEDCLDEAAKQIR
jgi:hypothetical protein